MVLCARFGWRAYQNNYAGDQGDNALRGRRHTKGYLFVMYHLAVLYYSMGYCQCPFCCVGFIQVMLTIFICSCFRIAEISQGQSAKNIHGSKGRYDRYCVRESDDAASGRLPGVTENENLALRKRGDKSPGPAVEEIKVAGADAKNDAIV